MTWRGHVVIATLLAMGIGGGFVLAGALQTPPSTAGAPSPVAAVSPSFPSVPRLEIQPDPREPALALAVPLRRVSLGSAKDRISFPAPVGWARLGQLSNEVKYKKPNNPNNTYVMRVEQVTSDHEQIPDMINDRIHDLREEDGIEQVKNLRRTHDQLEVSYVYDGYRRFALYTWLDVRGSGQAEVEIAITGRSADVPGMRDLMNQIIIGMEAG